MSFIPKHKVNVLQTFLDLTHTSVPHGLECMFDAMLSDFGGKKDSAGNWHVTIAKSSQKPTSMFTCHLDTVCTKSIGKSVHGFKKSGSVYRINHRSDGRFISSDGTTNIGADDKAGMTIMLTMMAQEIDGLYSFFVGEESGGIGSGEIVDDEPERFAGIERCISFDRRGYNDVITHQSGGRCASDEFASALANQFARQGMFYLPCDTGIFTDSANFTGLIPECTNISVGYFNEHTVREKQDMLFLETLCKNVLKIRWDILPTKRAVDRDSFDWCGGYSTGYWYDEFDGLVLEGRLDDAERLLLMQYGDMEEEDFQYLQQELEDARSEKQMFNNFAKEVQ